MVTTDAVSILDALQIKKAHVIGISMGGVIARQFALDYPDRISSLVLLSSVGLMNQKDRELKMNLPVTDMLRVLLRYGFRE